MSQQIRQAEIFAGEDWTVLYRAFTQINFNSYDPPSINAALREYLQTNYPEDFNDWIESSEFVAIIDLLSWLAGSLAFRTDVNARENFLETAQARESVLRLARFLSYNPRRAQSARGLAKIVEVRTTQTVFDSFGVNLNNRSIKWNDPDNPDWMEQFTLILNAAMPATNPFGIPFKQATIGSAVTQLYRLNNTANAQCVYPFNVAIDGTNESFEVVNLDIDGTTGFSERAPNPTNAFHFLYRNDGKGNASTRTGFFLMFKQGSLNQELFTITNPVENRVLEIDTDNISETDVWTQSIDDFGDVASQWTKVPAVFGENITFTNIAPDIRDIFSVVTRDADQISLRFGDGRFGNVPVGNLKVWYRVVNGRQYVVRPRDMEDVFVTIPYVDVSGRSQTLTVRFSLQETVSNAVGSEDIDQIRRRAPQVYGAQNRMVSGEDYNVFPLTSNEIVKLRAVNRVYSGHSRYIDINDPTATFQDTVVFADDGILYRDDYTEYTQVPQSANLTPEQIINSKILPMLASVSLRDYMNDFLAQSGSYGGAQDPTDLTTFALKWNSLQSDGFSSTGELEIDDASWVTKYLTAGCKLFFTWTTTAGQAVSRWVQVNRVVSQGTTQIVTVDELLPDTTVFTSGVNLVKILPAFRDQPTNQIVAERLDNGHAPNYATASGTPTSEIDQIAYFVSGQLPFNLYYYIKDTSTTVFGGKKLPGQWIAHPGENTELDSVPGYIKVMSGQFLGGEFWSFETLQGFRYVFESVKEMRWHDVHAGKVTDGISGRDYRDTVTVLWRDGWAATDKAQSFDIIDNVYDPDGLADPRKVVVTPTDSDDDGSADNPVAFGHVVSAGDRIVVEIDQASPFKSEIPRVDIPLGPSADQSAPQFKGLNSGDDYFWATDVTPQGVRVYGTNEVPTDAANFQLRDNAKAELKFQWKHFAGTDIRIDPAPTNIIDVFVLTSEYDFLVRQWIREGAVADEMPQPPNDLDLDVTFSEFEQYKMFSDEVIWRPVKYKYLFGSSAQPELQAQIKVIRLPNSTLSDGEIRSRVITAINDYFDVNKWEFGETFYFSELSAYLHMQLATAVASIVIVPLSDEGRFGELYEVRCATDEVFISTAQVSDVVIIGSNTMANLRIK